MWKLTVVAEAPPVIVWVAVRVCLRSMIVESAAPTVIVVAKFVPPRPIVKVAALNAVFVITMLVTTVVVADGTVYKVVEVVVVAAPLKSVFGVFGI
jgi:hypothetical protein